MKRDVSSHSSHLARQSHRVIAPRPDADLPDGGASGLGEGRDQPRFQNVVFVTMARVLVLAEAVHRAFPGKDARMYRASVHFPDFALQTLHPAEGAEATEAIGDTWRQGLANPLKP